MVDTQALGTIIAGSLNEGFSMRIFSHTPLETIKTGKFVCISGTQYRFFSLITDLRLTVSHPDIVLFPPSSTEHLLKKALAIRGMSAVAVVRPLLMLDTNNRAIPVNTIPGHFSPVFAADEADIEAIFGKEADASGSYFAIGKPLDMD